MIFEGIAPPGPFCWFASGRVPGPERYVVGEIAERLLDVRRDPTKIRFEYRITPRDRVDIAYLDDDEILLIECKATTARQAAWQQVERYLAAGRRRWPDRKVTVVLVAPSFAEPKAPPSSGIFAACV